MGQRIYNIQNSKDVRGHSFDQSFTETIWLRVADNHDIMQKFSEDRMAS